MSTDSEFFGSLKTDLTLGLPGGTDLATVRSCKNKRGFSETNVDLNLGASSEGAKPPSAKIRMYVDTTGKDAGVSPKLEFWAQIVGWPPVRKNMMKGCKYVKVAVDGAPFLRKVDLQNYSSYQDLLAALENMFTCFTICNVLNERKIMDPSNGTEYLPAYEDKDGDWMLVGDVPWKMFVESCKRLRLMKSSEAIGLAPKASSSSSSTS